MGSRIETEDAEQGAAPDRTGITVFQSASSKWPVWLVSFSVSHQ
ncbi:hypothetical protein QT971_05270 [Microcoleus sp. herbarium19]